MTAPKMSDVFALPLTSPDGDFLWSATGRLVGTMHGRAGAECTSFVVARAINSHDALVETLEAYEQWEIDLVLQDGLPRMTQALFERWIELQAKRNAALAAAKGE